MASTDKRMMPKANASIFTRSIPSEQRDSRKGMFELYIVGHCLNCRLLPFKLSIFTSCGLITIRHNSYMPTASFISTNVLRWFRAGKSSTSAHHRQTSADGHWLRSTTFDRSVFSLRPDGTTAGSELQLPPAAAFFSPWMRPSGILRSSQRS